MNDVVQTYNRKSNARRAAKAAGLDPDTAIVSLPDGTFKLDRPNGQANDGLDLPEFLMLTAEQRQAARDAHKGAPVAIAAPQVSLEAQAIADARAEQKKAKARARKEAKQAIASGATTAMPLTGKDALRKIAETQATETPTEEKTTVAKKAKAPRERGAKDAMLIKMLQKGATVAAMCKALEWLPHTLRARLSRMNRPKKAGGEGFKLERSREDGVTSYRIA